jgi:hypothetical protein
MSIEQRIKAIEERNARVEADKAWETSWTRRIAIVILTYIVVLVFFLTIRAAHPFLSALVPAMGFLLSTLTISALKKWWLS